MNPEPVATPQTYEFGPFRLDAATRVLLRDGRIAPLPPKVLDTLVVLIQNHGQLVEKERLRRVIWPDTYVDDNSLMHNISVLRKTLGAAPDGKAYIETAPRRGYRFTGTVRVVGDEPVSANQAAGGGRLTRFVPLAAGLLLMILAVGAIWMKSPAAPPLRVTPLTSYPGTEAFPTFSPDGRQVAFVWNGVKQDQFDIYVKTIGVDPPHRLTSDPEPECNPQWSPDGAWLAFVDCEANERNAPAGMAGLYIMPSSGGQKRRIGYIYNGGPRVAWTADSKSLIVPKVLGGAPNPGLVVLSADTGAQRRQLTWPKPGDWDSDPAISPDGRTLAYVHWVGPGLGDIYLMRVDEELAPQGEPKRLTFEKDYIASVLWTSDGAELLYVAGHDGSRGGWRVRARPRAAPRQIPVLARAGTSVALSRRGMLAYSNRYCDFDIWRAEVDALTTSQKPAELIVSSFSDGEPGYSPDGKSIAFHSNRSGFMEIWLSNADGSAARQMTFLNGEAGSPAWSADGSQIVFDCRLEGNVDVYIMSVADAKVRRLTTDPSDDTVPSWSSDGKWIYFASRRSGRLDVWKAPSRGGEALPVTTGGGFRALESTDGRFLFYSKTSGFPTTLWRKSLETGQEEQIIDSLRYWFYYSVFRDGIYFIPDRGPAEEPNSFHLAFYEFATRSVQMLAQINKWPGVGFSVSPDRRWVLFSPCDSRGADLMLVENFR
jgi:Tol biopolymer transport system component/DNA-binding winged helix-turn-helix (wHTH) protein